MGKKSKKKSSPKPAQKSIRSVSNENIFNAVVIGLLLVISIAWWWPNRYLPFWWDSAGFVVNAAKDFLSQNFNPPIALHSDFAHPPLVMMLIALAWKIGGIQPLMAHSTVLPFIGIFLIATYFLAKKLVAPISAFFSALIVATVPIVLHEASQVYLDLPAAALSIAALALLFHKKYGLSVAAFILAALSRETVLLVLPLYAFLGWKSIDPKSIKHKIASLLGLLSPLLAYLGYVLIFHAYTGFWFSSRSGRFDSKLATLFEQVVPSLKNVGASFFIDNGMWVLSLLALGALIMLWHKKMLASSLNRNLLGFLLTTIGVLCAYAVFQEYTLRYSLMVLPLWIITVVAMLEQASTKLLKTNAFAFMVIALVGSIGVFAMNWYPKTAPTASYTFSPPTNLTALDRIFVFRQVAKYLELTHGGKETLGSFPENQQLTQPFLGYVDTPLPFSLCDQFSQENSSENRLLVFHPYSPGQIACKKILDTHQVNILQRFERNGSWAEVYEIQGIKANDQDKTN